MATVASPLPGVFYRRPAPDKDEYVQEGDEVTEGQTIGMLEVMKNFTELKSTSTGTLKEFLVEDEGEVSVGQDIAVVE
ncbi:MAG: acetyl-CoA carboxylase [Ornithinimicrobium sp.]